MNFNTFHKWVISLKSIIFNQPYLFILQMSFKKLKYEIRLVVKGGTEFIRYDNSLTWRTSCQKHKLVRFRMTFVTKWYALCYILYHDRTSYYYLIGLWSLFAMSYCKPTTQLTLPKIGYVHIKLIWILQFQNCFSVCCDRRFSYFLLLIVVSHHSSLDVASRQVKYTNVLQYLSSPTLVMCLM